MSTAPTDTLFSLASERLLTPTALDLTSLTTTLDRMAVSGVDDADLYFEYTRAESWSLDESIVKSGSFQIDQGVGLRAIHGEKTAFAYSDDLSPQALTLAADTVKSIARQGQTASVNLIKPTLASSASPRYEAGDPITSLNAEDKVALLHRVETITRALDPRIVQVMAGLAAEHSTILVASLDGRISADIRPLTRLSITVIIEEQGRREQGYAGGGGRFGYGVFDDAQIRRYAEEAVHQAATNLAAIPAPAGQMPVVLGSGWPGILLHEAIGHGLEGDFNRKGSSAFSGRVGERVAAEGVTVVDDGTLADRRGSLTIDDEGQPTQRTVLIENGILKQYLFDRMNARLMATQSTGNGRRESFAHLPLPRMTNTLMEAGALSHDEIIASVDRGIYAANFGGGQVDITSGKFVFSMAEAYLIEGGKITAPIKGATLIGNGPDALTRVKLIGNNLALDPGVGSCGKEGQNVPVGVGQPTLRIDGLTVGGTT